MGRLAVHAIYTRGGREGFLSRTSFKVNLPSAIQSIMADTVAKLPWQPTATDWTRAVNNRTGE